MTLLQESEMLQIEITAAIKKLGVLLKRQSEIFRAMYPEAYEKFDRENKSDSPALVDSSER